MIEIREAILGVVRGSSRNTAQAISVALGFADHGPDVGTVRHHLRQLEESGWIRSWVDRADDVMRWEVIS